MATKIIPTYRIPKNKRIMTTREHEKELLQRGYNVKPVSIYQGLEKPVLYRYPCGHEKEMCPSVMKRSNHGKCIVCNPNNPPRTHQLTTQEFRTEMKEILPMISIIGEYTRSDKHVKAKCLICGYVWSPIAHTLKQGHGCPNCRYINSRISSDEFKTRIEKWHYSFDVLTPFSVLMDFYLCKCRNCGYEWKVEGRILVRGRSGCPNCFTNSKGEYLIKHFLKTWGIRYCTQKKFPDLIGIGGRPLMYDFFISSQNVLIEFQGIQHERVVDRFGGQKQFEIQKEHDIRKRRYAEVHNIKFIEIWYYDYDKIEEILKTELNIESVETVIEA